MKRLQKGTAVGTRHCLWDTAVVPELDIIARGNCTGYETQQICNPGRPLYADRQPPSPYDERQRHLVLWR